MKLTATVYAAVIVFAAGAAAFPQAPEASIKPTNDAASDADINNLNPDQKKGVLVLYTDDGDSKELSVDSYWPGVVEARSVVPGQARKFTPASQYGHHREGKHGEHGPAERRSLSDDTTGPVIEIMPQKRMMWINKGWMMQHGV